MTDNPQLHRDLGRVEGRLDSVETTVAEVKVLVAEMHETILQARGGWRVLVMVGTTSAAIGALVTKILGVFWK